MTVGAFANTYVPGSNILIDKLQDKATRALDKKLDKEIDGLGFRPRKGTQAMKDRMAALRAMKGKKSSGGSFKVPTGGSFKAPSGGSLENNSGILGVTSPYAQIQNTKLF